MLQASDLVNGSALAVGDVFSTMTASYSDAACDQNTVKASLNILPHSAPLGLKFYDPVEANLGDSIRGGAFITYREHLPSSSNRTHQTERWPNWAQSRLCALRKRPASGFAVVDRWDSRHRLHRPVHRHVHLQVRAQPNWRRLSGACRIGSGHGRPALHLVRPVRRDLRSHEGRLARGFAAPVHGIFLGQ
jgi:hypothetical protein